MWNEKKRLYNVWLQIKSSLDQIDRNGRMANTVAKARSAGGTGKTGFWFKRIAL